MATDKKRPADSFTEKPVPLEKATVKSILKHLNAIPGCYAIKIHGSPFMAGQPDILGCYKWRMFAWEIKRLRTGRLTPLQEATLEKWAEAGAFVAVVRSLDEAKSLLESYEQRIQEERRET